MIEHCSSSSSPPINRNIHINDDIGRRNPKLEIGKPSEEERGRAAEKNGGQIEREVEEEECDGQDGKESGGARRNELANGVKVG
ncbi:hypothetical protein ACFX15_018496 [Malus domestica]